MNNVYIIVGSWKIRHSEPLIDDEKTLFLCQAKKSIDNSSHSIFYDVRDGLTALYVVIGNEIKPVADPNNINFNENLGEQYALGVARILNDCIEVTHLTTRVELYVTHMMKSNQLPQALGVNTPVSDFVKLYDQLHIYFNNFECMYSKGLEDIELEQKYNIDTEYNFYQVNRLFYEKLDKGEIKGFSPQLGDEIQHWSYDNNFFEIMPNDKKESGYLSVMYWSRKKKNNWNENVVTLKKKLYEKDCLERWERNYPNISINHSPEDTVADFFGLSIKRFPDWRRVRLDIACEALATGNIFMVNFEDCRLAGEMGINDRIQQCEIEYLKTRGNPNIEKIYEDFEKIKSCVEKYMASIGVNANRTNYSKLTFLKDCMDKERCIA